MIVGIGNKGNGGDIKVSYPDNLTLSLIQKVLIFLFQVVGRSNYKSWW
jgi:hypothetical protein